MRVLVTWGRGSGVHRFPWFGSVKEERWRKLACQITFSISKKLTHHKGFTFFHYYFTFKLIGEVW